VSLLAFKTGRTAMMTLLIVTDGGPTDDDLSEREEKIY